VQEVSARRQTLSFAMLAKGLALLVTAGVAPAGPRSHGADDARRGGTLRLATGVDPVDFVDPALAYSPLTWGIQFATCAKLFNTPDQPGVAGARTVLEVVRRFTVAPDGRTYTFELRRSFRSTPVRR
jgi:hypothetical protein